MKPNQGTPTKAVVKVKPYTLKKGVVRKEMIQNIQIEPSQQFKFSRTKGGTISTIILKRRALLKKGTDSEKLVNLRFQPLFGD